MKTARILVVDDDDHVREALIDELTAARYRVDGVGSGGEAFDALAAHQYDVIISDLTMPDHDGIEVLEFARKHQRDAVRVLLTGYLDERARNALLSPDAPYKVGKPWHDEIEVVVRRGLEQRELARQLNGSVEDALGLATFDAELAATTTPIELAQTLVRRALAIGGVASCATVVRAGAGEHLLAGGAVPRVGPGWHLDLALDVEGELRLHARGITDAARQLVIYMVHRTQRACGILEARSAPLTELLGNGARMNQLMRQATIGALTSSLLHDLASTMQSMSAALGDLPEVEGPELADALAEIGAAGNEVVELFVQMRKFIRDGEVQRKAVPVRRLIDRALRLVGGCVRERATIRLPEPTTASVQVAESLFLQVLCNLLRNAAQASPAGGTIDLQLVVRQTEVIFMVIDDGPGVPPPIAETMFEPLASCDDEGTGLGLAISAYVMQMCGGRIAYRKDPVRGACFSATLPRAV